MSMPTDFWRMRGLGHNPHYVSKIKAFSLIKILAMWKMAKFVGIVYFVVLLFALECIQIHCSSFYFGARIAGDAIIMKDVLHTSPSDVPINHTIQFSYPIRKQIATFIQVSSKSVSLTCKRKIRTIFRICCFSYFRICMEIAVWVFRTIRFSGQ